MRKQLYPIGTLFLRGCVVKEMAAEISKACRDGFLKDTCQYGI